MKIKLYTYPDGVADSLAQDEIVMKKTPWGSFTDCYVANLVDGDVYDPRIKEELPPRKAEEVFKYLAQKEMTFEWIRDVDFKLEAVHIWIKGLEPVVKYPFHDDAYTTLREAVEYIMDMEEL